MPTERGIPGARPWGWLAVARGDVRLIDERHPRPFACDLLIATPQESSAMCGVNGSDCVRFPGLFPLRGQLSVWPFEYSRSNVFDRPVRGRAFFEAVIREHLDLGRPDRKGLKIRPT